MRFRLSDLFYATTAVCVLAALATANGIGTLAIILGGLALVTVISVGIVIGLAEVICWLLGVSDILRQRASTPSERNSVPARPESG